MHVIDGSSNLREVVAIVIFFYDALIMLPEEMATVWSAHRSFTKSLYFTQRTMTVVGLLLGLNGATLATQSRKFPNIMIAISGLDHGMTDVLNISSDRREFPETISGVRLLVGRFGLDLTRPKLPSAIGGLRIARRSDTGLH